MMKEMFFSLVSLEVSAIIFLISGFDEVPLIKLNIATFESDFTMMLEFFGASLRAFATARVSRVSMSLVASLE